MATTTRLSLRYPVSSDTADVPRDIGNLASDIDKAAIFSKGTFASRPTSTVGSPGIDGRYYFATDTSRLYLDTGTSWVEVDAGSAPAGGDLSGTLSNATIATGAVTSAKIADATIAAGDLASNAVTADKLAAALANNVGVNQTGVTNRSAMTAMTTERTTTSGSFTDVTGASFTFTVASGSYLQIGWNCQLKSSGSNTWAACRVLAGAAVAHPMATEDGGSRITCSASTYDSTYQKIGGCAMFSSAEVGTGSQTFKFQFAAQIGGISTAYIDECYLTVKQVTFS